MALRMHARVCVRVRARTHTHHFFPRVCVVVVTCVY